MAVLTLNQAQLAFGHVALLDHASFSLETSERVGLIGRNGTGKSSLLKILAGLENQMTVRCRLNRVWKSLTCRKSRHLPTVPPCSAP